MKESTLIEQFLEEKEELIAERVLNGITVVQLEIGKMLDKYRSSDESISKEGLKFDQDKLDEALDGEVLGIFIKVINEIADAKCWWFYHRGNK